MKVEGTFQAGSIKFELIDFFESDEIFVEGTIMLERAKKMGAIINWRTARKLQKNKHLFPKEVEKFDIVLAGIKATRFGLGKCRAKVIPYFHRKSGNWVEGFGGVKYDWGEKARLLRACN